MNDAHWKNKEASRPIGVAPEYLTASQVSMMIGFSKKALENFRAKRIGPPWIRVGSRCVRYRATDVRAWIEAGGPVK